MKQNPKKLYEEMDEIIGFFPTNQNTTYLLCIFYSENEIITVRGRPATWTLIDWVKVLVCSIPCLDSVSKTSSVLGCKKEFLHLNM